MAIAKISPVEGSIRIIEPPFLQSFSSTACFKYFSTIDWMLASIDNVMLLPFSGSIYFSSLSGIDSWVASIEVVTLPGVPVKVSSQ